MSAQDQMTQTGVRFGIDLGGTKIEIIALNETGIELLRRRVPTPQGDYQATISVIAKLVEDLEHQFGQRGSVGLGIPGAESADSELIKNANSTCLIGKPLRHDLQTLLQRDIRLENDANCFALSEACDGAGKDAKVVFGVILGTGVGGGIVVHGQLLTGANHIAGEWGHNPLPFSAQDNLPPPVCYCGRQGCIESWLSGPGLSADHLRHTGTALAAHLIAERADLAEAACIATLERHEHRLARALAQVINILDPDVIVLGGGLSKLERLYTSVPKLWGEFIFTDHVRTQLRRNQHGDSSGVRGAAWLWDRDQVV
ncbi:MAG: ROK family protein [Betaproteobacteria bacterium]